MWFRLFDAGLWGWRPAAFPRRPAVRSRGSPGDVDDDTKERRAVATAREKLYDEIVALTANPPGRTGTSRVGNW